MAAVSRGAGRSVARLELLHAGRQIALEGAGARLAIGRDAANAIALAGRKASRVHARIECRRDKFFLTDQSTNGTYVTFAGEAEVVLRHEEIMLRGQGRITFGHSLAESAEETVTFQVR
jgi:predicted component of type VI protein secretion system